MTLDAQVQAVVVKGFTERQARFLVLVMRHAGVCVMRQYATFADIVFGAKTRAFFAKLLRLGYASSFDTSKGRGRLFHIHGRELYEAIGEPHSRFRRPPPVAHAIGRCMMLDVVLAHPDVVWLEGADDKVAHLTTLMRIPLDDLPHAMVGIGARRRLQYFPDKLPVGIHPEGRVVLAYLPVNWQRDHLADFVQRHMGMLNRLPAWTIKVAEPHHPSDTARSWADDVRKHLAQPLRASDPTELRWYFERLKNGHRTKPTGSDDARLARCVASFGAPRFRALYRAWLEDGDRVLDVASSPAIAKAIASGAGIIEPVMLSHGFRHLSFLVASEQERRSQTKGAKLGDEVREWLQPRARRRRDRQDGAPVEERRPILRQATMSQRIADWRLDERAALPAARETARREKRVVEMGRERPLPCAPVLGPAPCSGGRSRPTGRCLSVRTRAVAPVVMSPPSVAPDRPDANALRYAVPDDGRPPLHTAAPVPAEAVRRCAARQVDDDAR